MTEGILDSDYTKKEAAEFRKELSKLSKNLSGIREYGKSSRCNICSRCKNGRITS